MKKAAALVSAVLLVITQSYTWAERAPDVRSLDRSTFDYAFSRADRETTDSRWIEEARRGLSLSMSSWERTASVLYEDTAEYEKARESIRSWTESELEERFTAWLKDRFFGSAAARLKTILQTASSSADKKYLYLTDAQGNVLYDEATGDPLTVRPDQCGDTLAADASSRVNDLTAARNAALASYRDELSARFPELLAYVREADRAVFSAELAAALSQASNRAATQLDAMMALEERLFVARRTGDVWSLRKQSESEAASAIVRELALQTQSECDAGLKALEARVTAASAGTGDLALAGKDWLEEYKTQFGRGLSAWQKAEERFIVRRMEWEREASKSFTENQQVWADAFEKLSVEQRAWESKASALFASGEETFARASQSLERAIAEAKNEFDRDASLRGQATSDRARAWVDTYVACGSVVSAARENAEFWLLKMGWSEGRDPAFGDTRLADWLAAKRAAAVDPAVIDWCAQVERWTNTRSEYLAKATDARNALVGDFGIAIGSGSGDLRDVLDPGASSEDFALDEYQLELVRAKAVAAYWAKRVSIAEAVSSYAADLTAGRSTEAESVESWKRAKAGYDMALASYVAAQDALSGRNGDVNAAREGMSAASAALKEAETALDALNSEYAMKMSVLATKSNDFLKEELAEKYKSLLATNGLLNGNKAADLRARYLEYALAYGRSSRLESAGSRLRELVNGTDGSPSLADLKRSLNAVSADTVKNGLPPEVAGDAQALAKAVTRARTSAQNALQARIDAISMLAADDISVWYRERTGTSLTGDIGSVLSSDIVFARRSALRAKAGLIREALSFAANPSASVSADAKLLSNFIAIDGTAVSSAISSLYALESVLSENAESSDSVYRTALEALASSDATVRAFLRGSSFFALSDGSDAADLFLSDSASVLERAEGLAEAYRAAGPYSRALETERKNAAWNRIAAALADVGVAIQGDGLPNVSAVGAALRADSRGVRKAFASLYRGIADSSANTADWVKREIEVWLSTLSEYIAARMHYDSVAAPTSVSSLQSDLNSTTARSAALRSALADLASANARDVKSLCDVLECVPGDVGGFSRAAIESEIVRRISISLADAWGAGAGAEAVVRAGIEADAASTFAYASSPLRDRSIDRAVDLVLAARALSSASDPDTLSGYARQERLKAVFGSLNAAEIATAADAAFTSSSQAAYALKAYISSCIAASVSAEDFFASSSSWISSAPGADEADYTVALREALDAAYNGGIDFSLNSAKAKLDAYFASSLASVSSYIQSLRTRAGGASVVSERALALCLAERGKDDASYLSSVLSVLSLRASEPVSALIATVSSGSYDLSRDTFLGLRGAYASEAASFYSGLIADQAFRARANAYGGAAVSGDPFAWARAQGFSEIDAARLATVIALGRSDDGDTLGAIIGGALRTAAFTEYSNLSSQAVDLSAALALSRAYESAAAAESVAASSGLKQWRVYLVPELGGINAASAGDPEGGAPEEVLRSASSWREGVLADTYEKAVRATSSAQTAFTSWKADAAIDDARSAFNTAAAAYAADPLLAWNETAAPSVASAVSDAYSGAYRELQTFEYRAACDQSEIARIGAVLRDTSNFSALEAELKTIAGRISAARAEYDCALSAYSERAVSFALAGKGYDAAYAAAKDSYRTLEDARFAYERQDAIRRWASTSYLSAQEAIVSTAYRGPDAELAYTRERRDHSSAALQALETLYDAEAETRPYSDGAYNAMVESYRTSFERMMLSVKARDALSEARAKETAKNQKLYEEYLKMTIAGPSSFARPLSYDSYSPNAENSSASWKDLLTVDASGNLKIAYDGSFNLTKLDAAGAARLKEYFGTVSTMGRDTQASTAYERRVRDWCSRMTSYGLSGDRFRVWGLARDYLIAQILKANGGFEGLKSSITTASNLKSIVGGTKVNGFFLNFSTAGQMMDGFLTDDDRMGMVRSGWNLASKRSEAWNSLSAAERADLEFYMVLSLTGCGGECSANLGLSHASELEEYKNVDSWCTRTMNDESWKKDWPVLGDYYKELNDKRNQYMPGYYEVQYYVGRGGFALETKAGTVNNAFSAYRVSCERLRALSGDAGASEVDWLTIENSLRASNKLTEEEIGRMGAYYRQFAGDGQRAGGSVAAALSAIAAWTRNERDDLKRGLDDKRVQDEGVRFAAQSAYRAAFDRYVDGDISDSEFSAAASAAYGQSSASLKTHLLNLDRIDSAAAFSFLTAGGSFSPEYGQSANDYAALIERAASARCLAELDAREAEWGLLRNDLAQKQAAWRDAANLILARGRADWKGAQGSMNEQYNNWLRRYQSAYAQSDAVWNASWLDSMKEKESWTARATKAADNAAGEALLALIGSDAEASGRKMDGLGSYLIVEADAEAAATTLKEALSSAGIAKMSDALGAACLSSNTTTSAVRVGLGGPSNWDSANIQAAAAAFARKTNETLASGQARILAAQAREAAEKSVTGLQENLAAANQGVKDSMDTTFIAEGKWQRSGSNYTKKVIVHSTLFQNMITENASVEGYIAYTMSPWHLETDLGDSALSKLDALGIQALIGKAQKEVDKKSEEVFGTEAENKDEASRKKYVYFYKTLQRQIGTRKEWVSGGGDSGNEYEIDVPVYESYQEVDDSKTKTKILGAGKFGAHVGYDPTLKESPNLDDGMDKLWQDAGTGEIGRLLRSYIYWSMKESRGLSEMNKPTYEKRFWDDRGEWFKAPTIRGTVDIGLQVVTTAAGVIGTPFTGGASLAAAVAINTAINMADDAVFTMMDVAGGYKGWEEAGLDFGKKTLTTAATSAISFGFGGVPGVSNVAGSGFSGLNSLVTSTGFSGVIAKTMLSGVQSLTTSTVTSAINAIHLDGNGLNWDSGVFTDGLRGGAISSLTGMTNTLTSGVLNLGLEGFTKNVYASGSTLSNFLGGMAGQGVNYALTGDFALNVMNLSNLTGGALKSGLLELHLGKNGATMNLGAGGASSDIGTIANSMAGFEAWGVNARMLLSGQDETARFASAMRTMYSEGGVTRAGFEDILNGRRNIAADSSGDYSAKTATDASTGITTTTLGRDAFMDGSRFGMNILLAHESYRNGLDDGVTGQRLETDRAVAGHIGAAASLAGTYGAGSLSAVALGELIAAQNGQIAAVMGNYDSSADYWKLMEDGSLKFDGSGWLKDSKGNYILDKSGNRIGAEGVESGLSNILGVNSGTARRLMVNAHMNHSVDKNDPNNADLWFWDSTHGQNNDGKGIRVTDREYRSLYDKRLSSENTRIIYDSLVAAGKMDQNPEYQNNQQKLWYRGLSAVGLGGAADFFAGNKYISYDQYKENNFIQGNPAMDLRAPIAERSEISTLFGAKGDASKNPHRGIDFAVAGAEVYPMFANDTTYARVYDSALDLQSPDGRHVDLFSDVTYTFKGEQRTDQLIQRILHLDNISVSRSESILSNTLLGISGNTGSWNGKGYGYHLHTDLSADQNRSPWLDLQGQSYASKFMSSYAYSGDNRVYYDPLIFLNKYRYSISGNAYQYNR